MLQYTDAGDCFSADNSASSNIVEVAATTDCPRLLRRRQVAIMIYARTIYYTSFSIAAQ